MDKRTEAGSLRVPSQAHGEQLQLALDWGKEPWNGQSPRVLTTGYSLRKLTQAARQEAIVCAGFTDPHQWTLFLKGKTDGS